MYCIFLDQIHIAHLLSTWNRRTRGPQEMQNIVSTFHLSFFRWKAHRCFLGRSFNPNMATPATHTPSDHSKTITWWWFSVSGVELSFPRQTQRVIISCSAQWKTMQSAETPRLDWHEEEMARFVITQRWALSMQITALKAGTCQPFKAFSATTQLVYYVTCSAFTRFVEVITTNIAKIEVCRFRCGC